MSVSFGLASTQTSCSLTMAKTGEPAARKRPIWMLETWVATPSSGAFSTVWSRFHCARSTAACAESQGP
jgi:hypothetical protein